MVNYFDTVLETIDGYHYIADIVDNHLGWKSRYPENIVKQYKILSRNAKCTVFNSIANMDFFMEHHLLEKSDKSMFISNWYELPILNKKVSKDISAMKEIRILYSGNMNDRVDWKLIDELLTALPKNVTLYLAGNTQRAVESMNELLTKHHNCKYLGPIDERNLLRFIESCLFAIVPHAIESTSKYMNPIKILMYAASGLKCVSTSMPGIENDFANLKLCEDNDLFIRSCLKIIEQHRQNGNSDRQVSDMNKLYQTNRDKYVELIHGYLAELSLSQ
jgi:glycosyltransferase involved in cell wall biosynthesis